MTELIVPRRFTGPPSSGNGGYTAGALAALVDPDVHHEVPTNRAASWPAVTVSLRHPPPLDEPMPLTEQDGWTVATSGTTVVARARVATGAEADLVDVAPVSAEVARAAEASYAGLASHPFPTCFACGTGREEGDGLRIFPGRVEDLDGRTRVAATWTPDPSLAEDWHTYVDDVRHVSLGATWAALDCIGAWAGDLGERLMVLGQMTARIDALPQIGEEYVVVGLARGQEGRKTFTSASLHDAGGEVLGTAEHVWIAIDPENFT